MAKKGSKNKPSQKQLEQVFDWLISGATRDEIARYVAAKKDWAITPKDLAGLIVQAGEMVEDMAEPLRDQARGTAIARLNLIYKRSIALQDYKVAIAAQKEINDLLGLAGAAAEKRKPQKQGGGKGVLLFGEGA